MKSIKLALAAAVSFGLLTACDRPEPEAPAVEPAAAAAPPAAAAPEPAPPAPTDPVPPPATDMAPAADTEEDDDQPQSGGDKVGTKPTPASAG